jgi:small subunit ribosomal protein S21
MANITQVEVKVDDRGIDRSLRKFKRQCEACGVVREYRKRQDYKKPSVKKKEKRVSSLKRRKKASFKATRAVRY